MRGICGAPRGGLYGCRFDAAGNNSDCGGVTVQSEVDDVVIEPLPQSGDSQGGASGQALTEHSSSPSSSPSPLGSGFKLVGESAVRGHGSGSLTCNLGATSRSGLI